MIPQIQGHRMLEDDCLLLPLLHSTFINIACLTMLELVYMVDTRSFRSRIRVHMGRGSVRARVQDE